ncbi:NUDIX hydrolase [Kitasatospora aburaviensis]|uniref:NUDIX domain-containing protein n=1 Tax=Kitasatospora aburaviensis TaxID=67265 RepID=A0ABW1F928_9ACTN
MTTSTVAGPVRVRAVLVHDGRVCLIRRQREAGLQHSLPGGVVEDEGGEEPADALRRELPEELGLDLAVLPAPPVLCFVQDQGAERPGETTPLRRRHLVFTAHLPDHLAQAVAAVEQDDPVWLPVADAAGPDLLPGVDLAAVVEEFERMRAALAASWNRAADLLEAVPRNATALTGPYGYGEGWDDAVYHLADGMKPVPRRPSPRRHSWQSSSAGVQRRHRRDVRPLCGVVEGDGEPPDLVAAAVLVDLAHGRALLG